MARAMINEVEIYYEEAGEGEPLIFLSGLMQQTRTWRPQVNFFSKGFRVITYEPRGQGRSGRPGSPEAYALSSHLQDLIGLLDHLRIDRASLVGLSQGGVIAQRAALQAPFRVSALVLADTAASVSPLLRRIFLSWIYANESGGSLLWFDVSLPWIFSERFIEANGPLLQALRDNSKSLPADVIIALLRANLEHNLVDQVHRIRIPTLVLCGERDLLTPPRHAQFLHDQIHGSELILFPECGHISPLEVPELFNRAVWEFLKKN